MFNTTAKFVQENGLSEIFLERGEKMVEDTNGMGWGFHGALSDIYYNFFEWDK